MCAHVPTVVLSYAMACVQVCYPMPWHVCRLLCYPMLWHVYCLLLSYAAAHVLMYCCVILILCCGRCTVVLSYTVARVLTVALSYAAAHVSLLLPLSLNCHCADQGMALISFGHG